jgi:hypothetical protein
MFKTLPSSSPPWLAGRRYGARAARKFHSFWCAAFEWWTLEEAPTKPMVGKRARKAEASGDADYDAVRRACSKAPPAEGGDLGAKLDDALKSGWSIEALKAYAFSAWRDPGCDHVTDAAWRLSVEFADSNGCGGGRDFLKRFKAEP